MQAGIALGDDPSLLFFQDCLHYREANGVKRESTELWRLRSIQRATRSAKNPTNPRAREASLRVRSKAAVARLPKNAVAAVVANSNP